MSSGFLFTDEYLSLPRPAFSWVIENIIPTQGSINIYGEPKAGKSFTAIGMAHAIANPLVDEWLGNRVLTHGPVMYLQADMSRSLLSNYLIDIKADSSYDLSRVAFADYELFPEKPFNIQLPQSFTWLRQQVELIQPVMVFLDVLRELFRGDENDSDVMANVMGQMRLATRGSAFGLISHAKKSNGDFDNLMGDNRGSGMVAGAVDMVMKVTRKHIIWEGRSKHAGNLEVERLDNGLHALNPEDQRRKQLLALAVADAVNTQEEGKKLNVAEIARDYASRVCEGTYSSEDEGCSGLAKITAVRHVKSYLDSHNITRAKAK